MPFTLSHAAAILPFHKWFGARLPLSALVIGSMAPDFAYFVPGALGPLSHSIKGLFTFCVPMGLFVYWIFQFVLREPTIALLPHAIRERIPVAAKPTARMAIWVLLALWVGAATHVLWDSFTHVRSSLFGSISTLQIVVIDIGGEQLRFYKVLQHVSTIIGLVIIAIWLYRLWNFPPEKAGTAEPSPTHSYPVPDRWRDRFVIAIGSTALISGLVNYALSSGGIMERELFNLAIGGMAGFAVAWLLVSIAIRMRYSGQAR
jgi:Domain of unknown function (DUF4184)